jgi:glucose-1-phosphate thymidylyltransferase
MAGGLGTRLFPVTLAVNKHLLPVHNKPLIYYPLSTLMLAGIREILIITNESDIPSFRNLLGDGSKFGINIQFKAQLRPAGIAEGLLISEDFILGHKAAMILGDNIFHGVGLGRHLRGFAQLDGAHCFAYKVKNPSAYGVMELDESMSIMAITEKPLNSKSDLAIPGLYFFDEQATELAREQSPSVRGELEITDLLKNYLLRTRLNHTLLPTGTYWIDAGTFETLDEASTFVRVVEGRQTTSIGNPIDIAALNGWI